MWRSLESIGFYTLSDARARQASETSRLQRVELLVTGRCNFRCPYCRHVGGADLEWEDALHVLEVCRDARCVRFSGGEPTLWEHLPGAVRMARLNGAERVAVSTNGSATMEYYLALVDAGVDDFSVSLDACCAATMGRMSGCANMWDHVLSAIKDLAARVYVTVGVVTTGENIWEVPGIIRLAHDLGVADIRLIPAAQNGAFLCGVDEIGDDLLATHPILAYRVRNARVSLLVRGLGRGDADRCRLVLDDVAILDGAHYPCIIYLREGGAPIGRVGLGIRTERARWSREHDVKQDPICSRNCLDVCREYNNVAAEGA